MSTCKLSLVVAKNIYKNHDFCKTISIILVNLLTWYSCLILMCLHRAGGDANHV